MTKLTFITTILLALIFAGLTGVETWMYRKWDKATLEQREIQIKLTNAQHVKTFTEQLLRRLAIDSQRDPALADFLKKHKVEVRVTNPEQAAEAAHNTATPQSEALPATTSPNPVITTPTPSKP